MRAAIVVPARFGSTRFPGKPLAPLTGATGVAKPLIRRAWEAAAAVPGIARILVATDDARIVGAARTFGAEVVMTPVTCRNGTERCAATLGLVGEVDVVVNLQGDAPLTPPDAIVALLTAMAADPRIAVATPAMQATEDMRARLYEAQDRGGIGGTTVVARDDGDALYFSKAIVPHVAVGHRRDAAVPLAVHLGAYAYRPAALRVYAERAPSALEEAEGLEQLRFLDAGIPVRVVGIAPRDDVWELNNPEDRGPVEAALAARGIA